MLRAQQTTIRAPLEAVNRCDVDTGVEISLPSTKTSAILSVLTLQLCEAEPFAEMDVYSRVGRDVEAVMRAGVQSIYVLTYNGFADLTALIALTACKLGLARAAKSELEALPFIQEKTRMLKCLHADV